jgi:hypothetical protein
MFKGSERLGVSLRRYLSNSDYSLFIRRSYKLHNVVPLNGIDPKDYSICFYPPDFLLINNRSGEWKFVEVKGPKDKLHFRQANWFVNLIPKVWKYEIFASLDMQFEGMYLCVLDGNRSGPRFNEKYKAVLKDVANYNMILKGGDL